MFFRQKKYAAEAVKNRKTDQNSWPSWYFYTYSVDFTMTSPKSSRYFYH